MSAPILLARDRRRAGLRQVDVAERMGVGQPRVAAIEKADPDRLKVGTVWAYYRALGMDVALVAKPSAA